MQLKKYQQHSLQRLTAYLDLARTTTAKKAFLEITEQPYRTVPQLPALPYACLRIPTGGGKTLVASHAVGVAIRTYMQVDHGVVLWLVPSNTIRGQTLRALSDDQHPYRRGLVESLGGSPVTVMDLASALYLTRSTIDGSTVVIVSTLAALRVTDTEGRKIYESAGALQHHFTGLPSEIEATLERVDGVVPYSLANVLRMRRPVVIMDEAHNARTTLSFDTLARFAPSAVIEFTATPETTHKPDAGYFASNVLHHVSAAELKAEQMIKLPIRLEIRKNWQETLAEAVARRDLLHREAELERKATGEYIRPILLVQAQPRSKEKETLNVDVVKAALIEGCKVPEGEIAIATGDRNEIEGVDLSAPDCNVRVIITVAALKEGWDCPFAYVLCSVAELSSSTAVEQILGRILRLPKATEKTRPDLNRAYAFVASQNFYETAKNLTDALVANGFEAFEAAGMVETPQTPSFWTFGPLFDSLAVPIQSEPDVAALPSPLRSRVTYDPDGKRLHVEGVITESERDALKSVVAAGDHAAVEKLYEVSQKYESQKSPAQKGEPFRIPHLGILVDGQRELFEESHVLDAPWKLSDETAELSPGEYSLPTGVGHALDIDVTEDGELETRPVEQIHNQVTKLFPQHPWTVAELALWLERNTRRGDVTATEAGIFLHRLITHLVDDRGLDLERLALDKFRLRDAVARKIDAYRENARKKTYQTLLGSPAMFDVDPTFTFNFDPLHYPANSIYTGIHKFTKHYYPMVGEMKNEGEEFECAVAIDHLPCVKHWVRNLARQPVYSFSLQTSSDRFYPDFVAELTDGRVAAIEYKGGAWADTADTKEKTAVGELWAARSNGRCVFLMVTEDMVPQLEALLCGK